MLGIDASQLGSQDRKKKAFSTEDVNLIAALAKGEQPEHEYFNAVLLPEIHQNNNILNIGYYIQQADEFEIPNLQEEQERLEKAQNRFSNAQKTLLKSLKKIARDKTYE